MKSATLQVVILAGGLGTRLGEVTKTTPKPMVLVAGRPYLEYQLIELRRQGITDVVILTGYLGDQIESYFGDGGRFGVSIRYNRELNPKGTGGGLRDAAHLLSEEFLLIYGDSYLPIDYPSVIHYLGTDPSAVGVSVVYNNRVSTKVPNNIALDEAGYLTRYAKDAPQTSDLRYVEAGVLAFRRSILEYIPPGQPVSLEKCAFPLLIARRSLLGFVTRQRFYDIGTPDRLEEFERLLAVR